MDPQVNGDPIDWAAKLSEYWPWIALAIAVIVGIGVLRFVALRRKRAPAEETEQDLRINVAALSQAGPSRSGPRLELYHVPVRLAVLVIAPTGRGAAVPSSRELPAVVNQIVPSLMDILRAHQPLFKRWPAQLSSQGFAATFFANLNLPGDRGKGTPWCALAGRIDVQGQKLLVGMALCSGSASGLGHINVERETDWLDILRVVKAHGQR